MFNNHADEIKTLRKDNKRLEGVLQKMKSQAQYKSYLTIRDWNIRAIADQEAELKMDFINRHPEADMEPLDDVFKEIRKICHKGQALNYET